MIHLSTVSIVILALAAIVALAAAVLIARCSYETRENALTITALLGVRDEADRRIVRIAYGPMGLPWTLGHAKRIRIRVPDRAIPKVASPEDAIEAGIRIQQSLGMDDSSANMSRPRWHEWTLSR
jgi:hypothetical protein